MKTRRSVRQWTADFMRAANLVRDKRVYQAGYTAGCQDTEKRFKASMPPIFGERPVYIPVASVQFLAPPPSIGAYEPPEKQTGPIAAKSEDMRAFLNTQSLPAFPGTGDVVRTWHKKHGKAGE
ncbi:MAG TPA: hypothetical protein VFQ36_24255 [Ktedonobacteraceae bacterium]|nr:hypothetical protein [Ktedonobacteraceae bacterium]